MLINFTVVVGASNQPKLTADASCHGDTVNPTAPNRRTAAPVAATIAATASANSLPPGTGNTGSASNAHTNAVNADRNGPARAANRRNQPRTVAAGRPNRCAIRRCPHPSAANLNATPITAPASARRARQLTGNNT